jgi:hypothetical protein
MDSRNLAVLEKLVTVMAKSKLVSFVMQTNFSYECCLKFCLEIGYVIDTQDLDTSFEKGSFATKAGIIGTLDDVLLKGLNPICHGHIHSFLFPVDILFLSN